MRMTEKLKRREVLRGMVGGAIARRSCEIGGGVEVLGGRLSGGQREGAC